MSLARHALLACWFAVLSLAGTCVLAQSAGPGIYTCVDAKGRTLTSDRLISDCVDRAQKLLNPSGTVKATVPPAMSDLERAQQEAKARQERDAQSRISEEKRLDRALLIRYPSRVVHDQERAQAIAQVEAVKAALAVRVAELKRERQRADEQMEFYKKDPSKAPPALLRQLEEVRQGIASQERFMAEQENEIARINHRFDDELERLSRLWAVAPKG
ncbi:MAG: hypothetical protein RL459_1127 [Pseudomonadota bacterium]|jgi:hypothetical protein